MQDNQNQTHWAYVAGIMDMRFGHMHIDGARKDRPNSYKGLPPEELNYREDMYIKMREFNGNKVGATTKSHGPERACDSLIL